ncbi:Flavin-containing monooxygenase [Melia azedarach]|uniref:Flavin-containing monooxygenase n=1 Tax=Melia azedarach TaxID=155640 RepID=A0ACC1XU89_MELAZ|nr:Flavin-containing monooxygenase [Melia azedarach]
MKETIMFRHVAVIGSGAAGLVAARELRREGHSVVVYEKGDQIGGAWVYTPQIESDILGVDPNRVTVHSSMYKSLRINFPREMMGFQDYPFVSRRNDGSRDTRSQETETALLFTEEEEIFDAVVVCNGHYTEPLVAEIPGISSWPGKQIHSHNYRVPKPFQDQVVILIGNKASGFDIKGEIATVAEEVHVADRSVADETYKWEKLSLPTVIIHCTGYKYYFPFLADVIKDGIVSVDDNRIHPLYKHVFPPAVSPGLSFVGIPQKAVPFPLSEYQSRWIAGVLSNRIELPSEEEMMEDIKAFYSELESSGKPKRHTHYMSDSFYEYMDFLAAQCGCPGMEKWRKEMEYATMKNVIARPGRYRDEWDDDHLIEEAHKISSNIFHYANDHLQLGIAILYARRVSH